jgi:hypothetical protein
MIKPAWARIPHVGARLFTATEALDTLTLPH